MNKGPNRVNADHVQGALKAQTGTEKEIKNKTFFPLMLFLQMDGESLL